MNGDVCELRQTNRRPEPIMKLTLAAPKVHLAHCAISPRLGRRIGLAFTTTGTPAIVATPSRA
jgi:hypothetical protein